MKEFQIKNISNIEPQFTDRDGNQWSAKPVCDEGILGKCSAAFVEVEPGSMAYGYHYHESKEEIFVIMGGEGSVRTIKGEIPVKSGDAVSFPTGEGGVHVIKNTSDTEKLVYIDFGTQSECEIVHLPDAKKIMVASQATFGIFDEPSGAK